MAVGAGDGRNLVAQTDRNGVGRNKAIQARSARWRFRRVRVVFAGNASSRCRSNRLIPAYRTNVTVRGVPL